jgi:hypothetical protein
VCFVVCHAPAVSCYPAEGTADNPNWEQPWARKRRRPLRPIRNSDACFDYAVAPGDTVAGIVDHFGLSMRQVGVSSCCGKKRTDKLMSKLRLVRSNFVSVLGAGCMAVCAGRTYQPTEHTGPGYLPLAYRLQTGRPVPV